MDGGTAPRSPYHFESVGNWLVNTIPHFFYRYSRGLLSRDVEPRHS